MPPPLPRSEEARLRTLAAFAILDSAREPAYDDVASLAAHVCRTPMAMIGFVDRDWLRTKATIGLDLQNLPRADAICAHAIVRAEPTIVEDAASDPRFATSALVTGALGVRFYAGVPLMFDGDGAIGTLSVLSTQPRSLSPHERDALLRLARQVEHLLELRRQVSTLAVVSTDRQRAHQAQAASESRYRLLADAATDSIVTVTDTGKVTFANPATCRLFGYTTDEIVGHPLDQLMPERFRGQHHHGFERYLRTGARALDWSAVRVPGRHKAGHEIPLELSFGEAIVDGARMFTGIIRDVSERERSEQALRSAREEAVAASRLKSEFLANMSHEVRTPMNGILGMLHLLLEGPLTDHARVQATLALTAAEGLLAIINDILDLSKIEAGRLELNPSWVSPRRLVETVAALMAPAAAEKGLTLTVDVADAMPAEIWADGVRLQQILVNLTGNAVKFTERGAVQVLASVEPSEVGRVRVRFAVHDEGIGIDPSKQAVIFDEFTQVDATTARRHGGTGLGLAISQRLVAAFGSRLEVASDTGRGSQFWFTLDVDSRLEAEPGPTVDRPIARPTAPRGALAGQRPRVLLAEDNAINRRFAVAVLESIGCEVEVAVDGQEAIDRVATGAHDLVLMDCQMPVVDGYEATRRIRASGFTLPIVALTAHAMLGDRERCLAAGMNEYLSKPINPAELRSTVMTLTGFESTVAGQPDERARLERCLDRFGGNIGLVLEVADLFAEGSAALLDNLNEAQRTRSIERLAKAAHTIKGAVGNFTDGAVFEAARAAERSARQGDHDVAFAAAADLTRQFASFREALHAWTDSLRNPR